MTLRKLAFGTAAATFFIGAALIVAIPSVQARVLTQIELVNTVSVEVEVEAADGTKSVRLAPANTVTPGDFVVYAIAYRNTGTEPVANVVINNPLPDSVEFVAPGQGQAPLVSIDGARFAELSELTVSLEDGSERPALASDVRHLRWTLSDAVAPAETGQVAFRARLK